MLSAEERVQRMRTYLFGSSGARLATEVVASVVVGVATGLGVAAFHWLIESLTWGHLSLRSEVWLAILPLVGLVAVSLILNMGRDPSSYTTEEYIRTFHRRGSHMPLASTAKRMLASFTTIASGGSMGLEGPSIFLGASIGDWLEQRWPSKDGDVSSAKILLVAGAAAGISAIFKAPVTGTVFALEVPYREDFARHALIPAIFASVSAYIAFVTIAGTRPLFAVASAPYRFVDLFGALAVGIVCGLIARFFVRMFKRASEIGERIPGIWRPLAMGVVVSLTGLISLLAFHLPLSLGPGYVGIDMATRGMFGLWSLILILVLKMVATSSTSAGRGVGGLFFPAVMMGAITGSMFAHVVPGPGTLFSVSGIAAFLAAVYDVPLAAVAFVAEATGAPAYIVPGLAAAAVGYLVSGQESLSAYQRSRN
jgi:CIC family chloride channel protein